MNRKTIFFIFLSVLAGLNLGSVRKAEDPIRDTQTNPILYEQKKEEEKDGKKGPLLYSVKNNPREDFFIDPPFEKEKKISSREIMTEEFPSPAGNEGWWEEQPTDPQTVSPAGGAQEPLPEPLPEGEKAPEDKASERPAAAPETEDAAPGKEADYWW